MTEFNRTYELKIGEAGGIGDLIKPPLRTTFQLFKDSSENPNRYQVSIYNVKTTTSNAWQKPDIVGILRAGYTEENGLITMCSGNVVTSSTMRHDNGDIETSITMMDGYVPVRDTAVSLSYSTGVSSTAIIQEIASAMGVSLNMATTKSRTWSNGFSFYGAAYQALHKVCRGAGVKYSFQNGVMQITDEDGTTNLTYLISQSTGLIGSPQKIETAARQKSTGNKLLSGDNSGIVSTKQKKEGWRIITLLLPQANPNDVIEIQSDEVSGRFIIESIRHVGDWGGGGNWISQIEAYKQ